MSAALSEAQNIKPENVRQDSWIITLVSVAHFASHVMQLVLPPLFPILREEFGVSYTQLGLIMTVFYVASGAGQGLAGVLVDRYGAHRLLLLGMGALSLGILVEGLLPSLWMFLPIALVAGLGNSVFHPADLSILSLRVSERRHGRAYALHGILGAFGYAASPVLMTIVATYAGWRTALIAVGVGGLVWTAVLYANRALLTTSGGKRATGRAAGGMRAGYLAALTSPVVVMGFFYFALTSFASQGVQSFGIASLMSGYGLTLALATSTATAYLAGNACGIFVGGFVADRTRHHHRVPMAGMTLASLLMLTTSTIGDTAWLVFTLMSVSGFAYGITQPSRDILIRQASAGAGLGSVFGFVYSGFDLGSCTAPLLFGALLDHQLPHLVFVAIAISLALAVPTVMQVRQRITRPAEASAAAD